MPKDALEYEAKVPAFLQRLKAGYASQDGRHNVQIPRPSRGKTDRLRMDDEGEDEPVVVDEHGQEVSTEDAEKLKKKDDQSGKDENENEKVISQPAESKKTTSGRGLVEIGANAGKKRRAGLGKVVGDAEEDEDLEENDGKPVKAISESTQDLKRAIADGKEEAKKQDSKKVKRKKIKLSFEEPE